MSETPNVFHNQAAGQFEIHNQAGTALLRYVPEGNTLDLIHTEVPPALEGRGYGEALAKAALDYAREEKLQVVPSCSFVAGFIRRHKAEYSDLLTTR